MKLYYSLFIHKWTFHLIPSLHLYIETNSPLSHDRVVKDGVSGVYFSIQWGKWLITIGVYKKLKIWKN
jgi:hypothetical protein